MSRSMYPIINSGHFLFGFHPDLAYDFLEHVEHGLMLDIGAAMGVMTEKMLMRSPKSKVIAFEPYPPNQELFNKRLQNDSRASLVKKAVSDATSGHVSFCVPNVVTGNEKGWESFLGYSSVGYISNEDKGSNISVPVTTVSKEVCEHVLFMKVDVQGGESAVLRGCHSLIRDHGIDVILIEFIGQKDVLTFLHSRGYILFDTRYLLVPTSGKQPENGWLIDGSSNLSTGVNAYFGWPINRSTELMEYCEMIRETRQNVGYIQTDIFAIHHSFLTNFLSAISKSLAQKNIEK